MNFHFISIDKLDVDKIVTIWLAFGCSFGFDKLKVDTFRLIYHISSVQYIGMNFKTVN